MLSVSLIIKSLSRHNASTIVVWAPLLFSQWEGRRLSCSLLRRVSFLPAIKKNFLKRKYVRKQNNHFGNKAFSTNLTLKALVPFADSGAICTESFYVFQIGFWMQEALRPGRRRYEHGCALWLVGILTQLTLAWVWRWSHLPGSIYTHLKRKRH